MSGPNRIIINGPPEDFDECVRIIREEVARLTEYTRIGWGFGYQRSGYPGVTFFVRRIKDGLSITSYRRFAPTKET